MNNNALKEKMMHFTNSIRDSLEQKNWHAALTMALTLPDICGKLEFPDKSSSKRFPQWFNKYLVRKYTFTIPKQNSNVYESGLEYFESVFLNGEDAYALRCAYLHQGETNIEDQRARKVLSDFLFVVPPVNSIIHCNRSENLLQLQVDIFCLDICNAVERWVDDVSSDQGIQNKAKKLMTIKQTGDSFSF